MDSGTLTNRLSAAISQHGGPLLAWLTDPTEGPARQQRVVARLTRSLFRARGRAADAPVGPCEARVLRAMSGADVLTDPGSTSPALTEHWLVVLWAAGCEDPSDTFDAVVVPEADRVLARVKLKHGMDADTAQTATARVALFVATRNRTRLRELLHAGNKLSRAVFTALTGASPDDVDGWLRAVGEGARVDAEHAAAVAAAEEERQSAVAAHAATKERRARERVDAKLEKMVRTRYGVVTMRELINHAVDGGATLLVPERDGKATTWWLRNAAGSGYTLSSKVEAEYAASAIERSTGVRLAVPVLPPLIVETQRIGKWDLAKPVDAFFPRGAYPGDVRVVRITSAGSLVTLKDAARHADKAAEQAEAQGSIVLERGVVVYDPDHGHKNYTPVLVLRDPVA